MVGMQYRINLPSDYNMGIIKKRVLENGSKTDGFPGLLFKAYLIQEKNVDGFENIYSPLYIWKDTEGMNKFLFEGYYDNIIKSFGWQNINIGILLLIDIKDDFTDSKYVVEEKNVVMPKLSLLGFQESALELNGSDKEYTARVCIYNPDKWEYSQFYFYKERPEIICENNIYQILHISREKEE